MIGRLNKWQEEIDLNNRSELIIYTTEEEYKKYKARTISDVERDYLESSRKKKKKAKTK